MFFVQQRAAGAFSIDLVAEDDGGQKVTIENQLEKSNHDHLGKVITYMVAMGAKTAVWIVSECRVATVLEDADAGELRHERSASELIVRLWKVSSRSEPRGHRVLTGDAIDVDGATAGPRGSDRPTVPRLGPRSGRVRG